MIGGKSERMGRPKSLLPSENGALSEKLFSLLGGVCDKAFLLGSGPLPPALQGAERICDATEFSGPLAGIVAAHRRAPFADWLVLAVDLPNMDEKYLLKLVSLRAPGARFIGAHNVEKNSLEPLAAIYSPQLLGALARFGEGELSINRMLGRLGIKGNPALFDGIKLKNVNYPEDL